MLERLNGAVAQASTVCEPLTLQFASRHTTGSSGNMLTTRAAATKPKTKLSQATRHRQRLLKQRVYQRKDRDAKCKFANTFNLEGVAPNRLGWDELRRLCRAAEAERVGDLLVSTRVADEPAGPHLVRPCGVLPRRLQPHAVHRHGRREHQRLGVAARRIGHQPSVCHGPRTLRPRRVGRNRLDH